MNGFDYIRIRGFETAPGTGPDAPDPGLYEMFQGICGAAGGGIGGGTGGNGGSDSPALSPSGALMIQLDMAAPISEDESLNEALWAAQNALIHEESAYLAELNEIFKGKQAAVPNKQNLAWDFLAEIAEWGAGKLAYLFALAKSGGNLLIAEVASFLIEIGTSFAIDALRAFLSKGQELCGAIQAENAALLQLPNSRANYELRRDALALHTEQIENMLHHINFLESQLADTLSGEEKGTGEEWDDWIASMGQSSDDIAAWLDQAFAAAERNFDDDPETQDLPVPVPPTLPKLPDTGDKKDIAFSILLRFGLKVFQHFVKHWIHKQHGKTQQDFLRALKDLQYNDEMLDLGGVRVWLKNKVIEYG